MPCPPEYNTACCVANANASTVCRMGLLRLIVGCALAFLAQRFECATTTWLYALSKIFIPVVTNCFFPEHSISNVDGTNVEVYQLPSNTTG